MTAEPMKSNLARIYIRTFKSADDATAFIDAAQVINDRITAVDVRYRIYRLHDDPATLCEIWEYPDNDAMQWVQSSMEGATVVPRTLDPKTEIHTATVARSFDCEE
jgi:hypothetical protein